MWHSRPCAFVGCRHNLYIDVTSRGSLKLNFPDKDWDEIPQTCSLDVADDGEHTLEQIGDLMNVTRERARQLEARGLAAGRRADALDLRTPEEKRAAEEYAQIFGEEDPDVDWEEALDAPATPQPPLRAMVGRSDVRVMLNVLRD
jgi:Sigma-70, region 4